jgi:uncharacterized protein YjbI with pentapeptide repeats
MRARRALEIGLVSGAALGFFVRGSVVQAPAPVATTATVAVAKPATGFNPTDGCRWNDRDLRGIVWEGEDLMDRDLADLDLRNASLVNAKLRFALLTGADLRGANLTGANLRGARLGKCDRRRAKLAGAKLTDAEYDAITRWPEGFDPQAYGARLDE